MNPTRVLYHIIRGRRSIRHYTSQRVERALVKRLLTAAIWAPSAHNRQPWRFTVIDDSAAQERLADAMNAVLRKLAKGDEMGM